MAAHYVSSMRRVQSHGPYHVLGSCFGATVAYEMARQLAATGDQVAFLGLLDPSSLGGDGTDRARMRMPAWLKRGFALGSFAFSRLRLYRDQMRGLGVGERLHFIRDKFNVVGEAVQKRDVFRGNWSEFNQRRVYDANLDALRRYKHPPLYGNPVVFEIFQTDRPTRKPSAGTRVDWNALAGDSAIHHSVPGKDSGDMLSANNVHALATILAHRLACARAK
jgi:thioesterase domain-containing protein